MSLAVIKCGYYIWCACRLWCWTLCQTCMAMWIRASWPGSLEEVWSTVTVSGYTTELWVTRAKYCRNMTIRLFNDCTVGSVLIFSSLGHRELRHDGENHSPDVTEVWYRPGRDRAAQWRPLHKRPAHSTYRQTRQPKGDLAHLHLPAHTITDWTPYETESYFSASLLTGLYNFFCLWSWWSKQQKHGVCGKK